MEKTRMMKLLITEVEKVARDINCEICYFLKHEIEGYHASNLKYNLTNLPVSYNLKVYLKLFRDDNGDKKWWHFEGKGVISGEFNKYKDK